MRRVFPASAAVCCAVLGLWAASARAEPAASLDKKAAEVLREVHNRGADLYNAGDAAACYRLFEGCLRGIAPLLDARPEVQADISRALDAAEKESTVGRKAFLLHEAIESARGKLKAAKSVEVVKPDVPKPPEVVPPVPMPEKDGRLGSDKAIKVVNTFFELAGRDPAVNFSRNGKYPADHPVWVTGRLFLKDWLLSMTGGKARPSLEPAAVAAALKAAGVTEAEYKAAAGVLRKSLELNGVSADDVTLIVKELDARRDDATQVEPPAPPKLELPSSATLAGIITLNGKPLAGATVQLVQTGDPAFRVFDAVTKEDGSFAVEGVTPGKYLVILDGQGLPELYRTTTTTPLKTEVKAGDQKLPLAILTK
jgi:hypothetical protein